MITKEQLEKIYNVNKPNWFVKFIYKYFSKSTTEEDYNIVTKKVIIFLIFSFLLGYTGTILEKSREYIGAATLTYTITLFLLILTISIGVIMNNIRLRRIRKILGISKKEYIDLVKEYYNE
jgi:hypothetical protein